MPELDDRLLAQLVCPVTHAPLRREDTPEGAFLVSVDEGRRYSRRDGVWHLVPDPLPADLEQNAEAWRTLQANGALVYDAAPEQNLTMDAGFAEELQSRLKLDGRVLDIGCGPQREMPRYLSRVDRMQIVGVDPLPGEGARNFPFVCAIAELLPFAGGSFDRVLFCRSLDHMVDFRAALRSAVRTLAPGGKLHVLMDLTDPGGASGGLATRWRRMLRRGPAQFVRTGREHGWLHALRYITTVARMRIPAGAVDQFHPYLPTEAEVRRELEMIDGVRTTSERIGDEILLTAIKPPAV